MNSSDDQKGTGVPAGSGASSGGHVDQDVTGNTSPETPTTGHADAEFEPVAPSDSSYQRAASSVTPAEASPAPPTADSPSTEVARHSRRPGSAGKKPPPGPPAGGNGGGEDDDEGMLRMSFLEHLEELRSRIIRAPMGIAVAFVASLAFTKPLWNFIKAPATTA